MASANLDRVYSRQFFDRQVDGSASSARVVVPIVLSLLSVRSVVDVGCGVGPWAAEFVAQGIEDVWGVDGDYVERSQLRIPSERFLPRDLSQPIRFDRTFDLAISLEVAEHLPESRARSLVADLTSLAPCVLFSAAIPGQGGTHHVNEQYLPYWEALFRWRGYEGIDPIRPEILGNPAVEWFYQQNIVMFAARGHELLNKSIPKPQTIIHPVLYEQSKDPSSITLGRIAGVLPGALVRSLRYRLGLKSNARHQSGEQRSSS